MAAGTASKQGNLASFFLVYFFDDHSEHANAEVQPSNGLTMNCQQVEAGKGASCASMIIPLCQGLAQYMINTPMVAGRSLSGCMDCER